jgi:hypothetical protein
MAGFVFRPAPEFLPNSVFVPYQPEWPSAESKAPVDIAASGCFERQILASSVDCRSLTLVVLSLPELEVYEVPDSSIGSN